MLRWGIVGFGDIAAKAVAPAIQAHTGSELVAICRRDSERLADAAREFGVAGAFTSYEEMLRVAELDAVYVATPVGLHAPQTLQAVSRGLHVLVEKPMGLNRHEAERMVAAAERAGTTLGIAFYHRFYPINRRVKELVESGDLGELIALHANASGPFGITSDDPKIWRVDPAQSGGGPLMDLGSHRLDIFYSLAGPARRVAALVDRRVIEGEVEDTATLLIEYESGVHATLASHWSVNPGRGDYEVWCTGGHVSVPYTRGSEFILESGGRTETLSLPPGELHDLPLIEDFVRAVEGSGAHLLPGGGGLEVQRVIDAAYASAREGAVITLGSSA